MNTSLTNIKNIESHNFQIFNIASKTITIITSDRFKIIFLNASHFSGTDSKHFFSNFVKDFHVFIKELLE